jgi:hypothetical protein
MDACCKGNYMTELYADDNFLKYREAQEHRIVEEAKQEVERKHLLSEMDGVLSDLTKWRTV